MKPYKKEDVEHVLEEFVAKLGAYGKKEDMQFIFVDSKSARDVQELVIGIRKLKSMLEKDEKEWTFDDYMSFYKVKEYLV